MELGQRLKQARLEMGLSQRQLCENLITRNMLSQIENGSARPSMDVLRTLAARLGKSISYFLEEDVVVSSNQVVMEKARKAYCQDAFDAVCEILKDYRIPDDVFDGERWLLEAMSCLRLAQKALEAEKRPLAVQLLNRCAEAGQSSPYYGPELERARCLLLAQIQPEVLESLPGIDAELRLRGKVALEAGEAVRAAKILDAAEDQTDARWCLLRGRAAAAMGEHQAAVSYLHQAEEAFPEQTAALLEACYRELEDYKMAYFYACRQKKERGAF